MVWGGGVLMVRFVFLEKKFSKDNSEFFYTNTDLFTKFADSPMTLFVVATEIVFRVTKQR